MSAEEVGKAFVTHFYSTFDTNAAGLAGLYVSFHHREEEVIVSCGVM